MKYSEDEKVYEGTIVHELEEFSKSNFVSKFTDAIDKAEKKQEFRLKLYKIFRILFQFFVKLCVKELTEKEKATEIEKNKDEEIRDLKNLLDPNFSAEDVVKLFDEYIPLHNDLLNYSYFDFANKYKTFSQMESFIFDDCFPLQICVNYDPKKCVNAEENKLRSYFRCCLNKEYCQTIGNIIEKQNMVKRSSKEKKILQNFSIDITDIQSSPNVYVYLDALKYSKGTPLQSEIVSILKEYFHLSTEKINSYLKKNIKSFEVAKALSKDFILQNNNNDDDDDNQNALDNIPDDSCITPQDKMIAKESLKNFVDTFMKVYNKFSEKESKPLLDLKLMGLCSNIIPYDELKHQSFYNKEGYQFVIASTKKGSINNKDIATYCKTNEVTVGRTINKFYYALVCNMKKNNLPLLNCVVLENQGQEKEYRKYLQKNNSTQLKVITVTKHVPVIERLIQESFRDYYGLIA